MPNAPKSRNSVRRARLPALLLIVAACATRAPSDAPEAAVSAAAAFSTGRTAYEERRFSDAATAFETAVEKAPSLAIDGSYSAACSRALAGDVDRAHRELERALDAGFRDEFALRTDPDLESLRALDTWPKLLAHAEANDRALRTARALPSSARLVLDDIERFAAIADQLQPGATMESVQAPLLRDYFGRASPGLVDFLALGKITDPEQLAGTAAALPRFYGSFARSVPALRGRMNVVRAAMERFEARYPDAFFPDVYFVVGHFRSGGTSTANGLVIGTELYCGTSETVLDELPVESRGIVVSVDELPGVVLHELTHFQQNGGGERTLLRAALVEGTADYVASLVLPDLPEPAYRAWGRAHAEEVRERFLAARNGTDTSEWIANNDRARPDWPAALGYYVGFEIARGYVARGGDERAALRDLFQLADPAAILAASGYAR